MAFTQYADDRFFEKQAMEVIGSNPDLGSLLSDANLDECEIFFGFKRFESYSIVNASTSGVETRSFDTEIPFERQTELLEEAVRLGLMERYFLLDFAGPKGSSDGFDPVCYAFRGEHASRAQLDKLDKNTYGPAHSQRVYSILPNSDRRKFVQELLEEL
jgi:hypothetical protein